MVSHLSLTHRAAAAWAFVPVTWTMYSDGQQAKDPPSVAWPVIITLVAVVATAVPLLLQFFKGRVLLALANEQTNEQAELIGLINGYLTPCIETLPQVASGGKEGSEALAAVKRSILGTVQQICGPSGGGVRAVWFEARGQTMTAKDWVGGECNSGRKFVNRRTDLAGSTAWSTARTGLPVLYTDLQVEAPSGYEPGANSKYQTFITCGVLGQGDELVGMLNVDAPNANELTEIDKVVVGVCAKILGAAYSLSEPRGTV